jgi:hypothetical protein
MGKFSVLLGGCINFSSADNASVQKLDTWRRTGWKIKYEN